MIILCSITLSHVGIVGIKNKLLICWLNSRSQDEKAALIQTNDGNQSVSLVANSGQPDSNPHERIDVISKQTMDKHKNTNDLESGTVGGIELAETKNNVESAKSVGL